MISQFFSTEVGALVYLVLLAAFADFIVGVWTALRDGTFQISAVGAFLRKHIVGRVMPVFGLLGLGYLAGLVPTPAGLGQFAPAVFTLAGTAAALIYVAETFGAILEDLRRPTPAPLTPTEAAVEAKAATVNEVPQD